MKEFLKKFSFYREGRYIWRSFVVYKKPFSYVWHRFIVGPRIRRASLPLDRPVETAEHSVHILCSHRDVTMLLWMLASWYRVLPHGMAGQVYIHEDGSFKGDDLKTIQRLLPHAIIVEYVAASSNVQRFFAEYPHILAFRASDNKLSVKLTDPYITGGASFKLVADTDILWFQSPQGIFEHMKKGEAFTTKGYAPMHFTFTGRDGLQEKASWINSGIVGYALDHYSKKVLDDFLEHVPTETDAHFVEQAAYGYLLEDVLTFLPEESYHIKGPLRKETVMKHFTGPRREMFWYEGVAAIKDRLL